MAKLIINGDVSKLKKLLNDKEQSYDKIIYSYNGKCFAEVRELTDTLLNEQNYALLKDFNECLFWVENNTTMLPPRTHYPMNMQIEHTSYCNARCIMCFHYYYRNRLASNMDERVYSKCLAWLPFVRTVGLHGFGEPFLAPNLQRYLDDYHRYGVKIHTNTNLSFIPPYLHEYYTDFQFINISCDGATKEIFEGIRQNMSFDVFKNNVKLLRREAPEVQLNFAVVLMRQNLNQCAQIVYLAASLGINRVMFSKIGINYVVSNYEDSVDRYPETFRKNLRDAYEAGQKAGIDVIIPCRIEELYESINDKKLEEEQTIMSKIGFWEYFEKTLLSRIQNSGHTNIQLERKITEECFSPTGRKLEGICDWLSNDIYISASGRVGFCCSNFKYYIGDLLEEELEDVWRGENYRRMTEVFQSGELPHFCRHCNLLNKGMLSGVEEIIRNGE